MISVVIPCYNEEAVLERLFKRVSRAAASWDMPVEVIIVDDGSNEETHAKLRDLHGRDGRWKVVRLSRNFGHQAAVSAGLMHAKGDAVVVMDGDLQDPPEAVQPLIEKWREGYEVVYAIRRKRKESVFMRACYRGFYRLLGRLSDVSIPVDSGDFCLMDRRVVDELNAMPEQNRFVRGLRAWAGFRQTGVEYEREARAGGEPKYSRKRLVQLAADGIFSFSKAPLQLATRLGFVISTVAFVGAVFTLFQRLFREFFESIGFGPVPGFATIVISILFLGGVQLICLGIIGEYLGRIYDEVKRRPRWIVRETLGLDEDAGPCKTKAGPRRMTAVNKRTA